MDKETIQIAQYLQQTMQKVMPMLDHESENQSLRMHLRGKYSGVNRNNTELRCLLRQIRRDSIKLEKLMKGCEI